MAPSLREIQQCFIDAVLHEQVDPASIVANGRFPAARRLQLYRNNVFESLTAALRAVYPAIERLVGDGFFRYAAHEYVVQHPPTSGNLHDFGNRFAPFLAAFPPASRYEYLPDVARLEWAWHEAFHAADAQGRSRAARNVASGAAEVPPLDPVSLANVSPEQYALLRFQIHPSARLVASRFPVAAIWEANIQTDNDVPEIDLDAGADQLLVVRRDLTVEVEHLGPGEYALLEAMSRHEALGEACKAALAHQPDLDLVHCLQEHVRRATLIGFSL
jgi:hypothetical protein